MRNNKFCTCSAIFSYNLNELDIKFPFATLFGGRKHRDTFNFFSQSELAIWCGPQDSEGKYTYICHIKRIEINAKKNVHSF